MQVFFSTREKARQFNAKRVASGKASRVVDNASKGAVVAPNRRFGVSLKG